MAVNKEKCVVVNDYNEVIDYKDRSDLDSANDRWRVSTVLLFNDNKQVLLAKRDSSKKIHPGLWGPTSAGTLEQNESIEESAYKELEEETGLDGIDLTFIGNYFYEGTDYKRFISLYKGSSNHLVEAMTPELGEVSELKWVDIADIQQDIIANPTYYVPNLSGVLNAFGINTPPNNTEFVHVVNKKNELLYFKDRRAVNGPEAYRCTSVFIEDVDGNALIQKRSSTKNTGAGKWENAGGGVVNSTETPKQNAYKELEEEVGLTGVTLDHVAVTVIRTNRGDRHMYWYKGVIDKKEWPESRFVLEKREVAEVKWINKQELFNNRDENPENYMPSTAHWRGLFT